MVKRSLAAANALLLAVFAFITLFPFLNVLAYSFSSSRAIAAGEVFVWPVEFNVAAFGKLIDDGQLFVAMKNTVIITVVGTLLQMAATTLAAYALSKKRLKGRKAFLGMILFTMLFGGGLIPLFLLLRNLQILDSFWAIWLPSLVSAYNLFVMKSFFETLPAELEESATIDGAGDPVIFWNIVVPLSKSILAAISLFYAVGMWNVYSQAVYFLNDSELMPLLVRLYQMIQQTSETLLDSSEASLIQPESIKAAAIVIAIAPILCVYPFLQKYFVKGVLLGSVKG
ncbi:ABC transporter permease subunit [Cohnella sp. CFH 77786]|uniref:carbohydrate ABC transporter permease n=1 Tax=Cohnella sp. CFH 77786 TaxID=2662265 RepID=UPI001C60F3A5|nr:carbohydrate ABC transporter permease [Cohnella sp. CFH 77786]MBW5447413.1 ABC transporter permease subunit [Cohnella sp. CFH 77786]